MHKPCFKKKRSIFSFSKFINPREVGKESNTGSDLDELLL